METLKKRGEKIGEDKYTEHWSLDGVTYIEVPKWVIEQVRAETIKEAVRVIEGEIIPVSSDEPFNPPYKPDGMSEEEYEYHIRNYAEEQAEWQSANAHNQALSTALTAVEGLAPTKTDKQ